MVKITIKTDDREINSILDSLLVGTKDFRPALKDIEKMQLKEIDEGFKVRGKNIAQQPWKQLKIQTVKQKIKAGVNKGILQRSGKMRKSFKRTGLTRNTLIIGNKVKYFKTHQQGFNKVPQRQPLGHGKVMIKRSKILLTKYILKLIKRGMM